MRTPERRSTRHERAALAGRGIPRTARAACGVALGAALALAAPACTPRAAAPESPSPAGPRVVAPSGKVYAVEVARTDAERAQGLMYRASLPADAGMVFLFDAAAVSPFWMKDCHFPIDIVFALSDGTVVDVLHDVPPCPADPCPSYPPKAAASTVLEVNAGEARTNGIVEGARLRFLDVPAR